MPIVQFPMCLTHLFRNLKVFLIIKVTTGNIILILGEVWVFVLQFVIKLNSSSIVVNNRIRERFHCFKYINNLGWKDGSAVKRAHTACSSQRTRVGFLVPTSACIPALKDLMPSSGLYGYLHSSERYIGI